MANLSKILGSRTTPFVSETNLERGEIWVYHAGTVYDTIGVASTACMCWNAPGTGTATVEIWGAGGSGGKMCCCGAGIPGNPGAYAKKTICVDCDTWIRGIAGHSCSNDNLCFKGCSQSTCIHICSPNGLLTGGLGNSVCICMCAEGGNGGMTFCNYTTQPSCCFQGNGYCVSCVNCSSGAGCFLVCNVGYFSPKYAYGGDINCNSGDPNDPTGNWSCTSFHRCYPCKCTQTDHVAIPPGLFSTEGSVVTFARECYSPAYTGAGDGGSQLVGALSALGRNAIVGGHVNTDCWSGGRGCGCYEWHHCHPMLPPGVPGPSGIAPDSVRDYGWRGGHGMIRIKFVGDS